MIQGRERTTPRPVAEPTAPEATGSTSTDSTARDGEAIPARLLGISEDMNAAWRELHRLQVRVAELERDTAASRASTDKTATSGPSDKPPQSPDR